MSGYCLSRIRVYAVIAMLCGCMIAGTLVDRVILAEQYWRISSRAMGGLVVLFVAGVSLGGWKGLIVVRKSQHRAPTRRSRVKASALRCVVEQFSEMLPESIMVLVTLVVLATVHRAGVACHDFTLLAFAVLWFASTAVLLRAYWTSVPAEGNVMTGGMHGQDHDSEEQVDEGKLD